MPQNLLELLTSPDRDRANRIHGVVLGIVTNNQDPDGLGRVKCRFPWLGDIESNWAWVATPMAGASRGFYCLPEVEDTVLVAFEQGDTDYPYILGALWNGQDPPPETNEDGQNNRRVLKSRSGHVIRLDDTDGAEQIEIIDRSGKNQVTLNTATNTITINAETDIVIEAKNGKLKLSGNGVEITSQADVDITAGEGKILNLKGGSQANLQASVVNIN